MKKILTLCLTVILYNISTTHAGTITKQGCINDDEGNRYSLNASSSDRANWKVQGSTELVINPGVQWATKGTYDTVTKRLTITLINPNPDKCRRYADSVHVVFRYIGVTDIFVRNGRGNFYNFCAGSVNTNGSLTAGAVPGSCGALPPTAASNYDNYGGVGSLNNLEPLTYPLPESNFSFNDIVTTKSVNVYISPNPVVDKAQISLATEEPSAVDIKIYDQMGRVVRTISSITTLNAGSYTFNWDLSSNTGVSVTDGLYLVVVKTGDEVTTQRIYVNR